MTQIPSGLEKLYAQENKDLRTQNEKLRVKLESEKAKCGKLRSALTASVNKRACALERAILVLGNKVEGLAAEVREVRKVVAQK